MGPYVVLRQVELVGRCGHSGAKSAIARELDVPSKSKPNTRRCVDTKDLV